MATDTAMVYRIGANLDELRKNLAEGKAIIAQVNADVTKMSGAGATATRTLKGGIDGVVPSNDNLYKSFKQVDNILESLGINARSEIKTLEQMREVATGTGGALDGFAKAGLIAAAAIGGWKIGEKIGEWTGWTDSIADATAKLLGFGDVAGQRAAAGADTLAKASKLVGFQVTEMDTAIKILTGDVEDHAKALNTSENRIAGWRQEIAKVKADGNWEKLTADLQSQNFELKELKDRYGISVDAMQFFTREQKNASDAIVENNKRILENTKHALEAQKEAREKAEQMTEALGHVSLAQGKYADVLAQFDRTLIANVQHWRDQGAAVQDIAVILGQPPGKIQLINDALDQQGNALDNAHRQWLELAKAQDESIAAEEAKRKSIEATTASLKAQTAAAEEAAKKAREAMVFTRTYDLSTPEGMAEFRRLNPGASITGEALDPNYFKTHTLQDAIAAGLIDLYAGFKNRRFASGVTNDAGGMALVGERGPEIVMLPRGADVIPNHQIGSAAAQTVHVTVNVQGALVGTQEQLARLVGEALMSQARAAGERFPVTRRV